MNKYLTMMLIMTAFNLIMLGLVCYNAHRVRYYNDQTAKSLDKIEKMNTDAIRKAKEAKAACDLLSGILREKD